jgi:hypothetical protein
VCITRTNHSVAFEWIVWLTLMMDKFVPPCHLMHLDVLFFHGWCMYCDYVQFNTNLISPLYFSLICLGLRAAHEKIIVALKFLFPSNLVYVLPVLFWKITLNWKVFSILSSSFSLLKFDLHFFLFFFCLRWLRNFICFFQFHSHFFFHVWFSFLLILRDFIRPDPCWSEWFHNTILGFSFFF